MKYLLAIMLLHFVSCKDSEPSQTTITKTSEIDLNIPIDSTLKEKLILLGVKDQTLRFLLPDVAEKFGKGSDEEKYFWSLIHEQDSLNEVETIAILEKHGWLGMSRIGEEANQSLWLVIQHAPLEMQEKYLPLLKKSVAQNESQGWHLAFLEDRILMYNEQPQIYGSQARWDKQLNKMRIYDIKDVENVNERRASLGLEPIEEYANTNGYVFDQL